MGFFMNLPHEILYYIFAETDPEDLAALSRTCTAFHTLIHKNRLLFKNVYLRLFDNRLQEEQDNEPAWEEILPRLVKLQKILESENPEIKRPNLEYVAETVISLLQNTSSKADNPANVAFLAELFRKPVNVGSLLCASTLYERARKGNKRPIGTTVEHQLSAKLHCYYGVPVEYLNRAMYRPVYPYAASKVYDLREYKEKTFWGPFVDDGSQYVDWEKVEAIMLVLSHNLQIFSDRTNGTFEPIWIDPFAGATPDSYIAPPLTASESLLSDPDFEDPYNVTGNWMRVITFLDYTELFSFNFSSTPPPPEEPREPLDTEEAIRLIIMNIKATKSEPPGSDDGQAFPVVHFTGTARALHGWWDPNATSALRGTVRLTAEGEVRWTTLSSYHGEERWRSEGIQIGGRNSARGVFGNWFDKDFDDHGPAGPTAFWKISDRA